jgi:hypothetical protein
MECSFLGTLTVDSAVCFSENLFWMRLVVIVVFYGRLRLTSRCKLYVFILKHYLGQGCTDFTKPKDQSQNSKLQKGNVKQLVVRAA